MASPPDPQQQHLLQLQQIRQQQLQLQQMQQQSLQQQQKQHSQQQQQHISPTPPSSQPTARFATPLKPQSYATPSPQQDTPPIPMQKKPVAKPPSAEQIREWVAQCDWKDRTIHVARQLLGGSTINGFLKATAAAQRVKKQRARQFSLAKKNAKRAADQETPGGTSGTASPEVPPTEEELKNGTMNARTAKKIKMEMEQGVDFVKTLYETIQGIIRELDPTGRNLPPPIDRPARVVNTPPVNPNSIKPTNPIMMLAVPPSDNTTTTSSPGDAQGSTLRKHRRRKVTMPPLEVQLEEYDTSGKRTVTKREHFFRIAEVLRFRALRRGDYVAARVSSRDLWILARVVRDYPSINMNPNEFLNLTLAKRDALFREKVAVKDAEEKESGETILVSRQLLLPLPRSYGEAAEWGTRYVLMGPEWKRKSSICFSICLFVG